jgi:hypothetical protein
LSEDLQAKQQTSCANSVLVPGLFLGMGKKKPVENQPVKLKRALRDSLHTKKQNILRCLKLHEIIKKVVVDSIS